MSVTHDQLLAPLKRFFGFSSFRPLQEEIIRATMDGKDVFAVLPTGGGKSLCFQLPALVRSGLTVVVSPLIALMKDQVDAMTAAGIAATFLNSSLGAGESRGRLRGLYDGEFRLLYVSPERLLMAGFLDDLKSWNVSAFAIDEAHCISEWGHDFRPEYRKISALRELFPQVPFMALTATATERVRADIVKQLHLREPSCFVASFNRPNLTYRVAAKAGAYEQVLSYIRSRRGEAGIIYCLARKTTEDIARKLSENGIQALPYHAGMDSEARGRNQESFLRDESSVVCATIAFGMGINKPNVRFVIHYDLPKNIEGYYQETGRAGRDGLPGECLLMFSPGDRVKQMRFIEDKTDAKEREIALAQLETMIHYAEAASCRREFLLGYFGERFQNEDDGEQGCAGCDNCLAPRQTWDGTLASQKFLSCVYRIREKSGFGVGLAHVIEVLTGADTEKVRKFGHQTLSTYNIGNEHSRAEWGTIGRELVRLGFVFQNTEKFGVLEVTDEGLVALKSRRKITLTKPVEPTQVATRRTGEIACDEVLFERLRVLRKQLADERSVPPYIIFSDVALRQMARNYPANDRDFSRITGVGEKKRLEFGQVFLSQIASHLQTNVRQIFAGDSFDVSAPMARRSRMTDTVRETLQLFQQGKSVAQISTARGLRDGTIMSHLEEAILAGEKVDVSRIMDAKVQKEIIAALTGYRQVSLSPLFDKLSGRYPYGFLRICRALKQANLL